MADIEFKNSVNANNAYVDGHKVQLIAVPDGNLELPISANDDSGYVVDANGKKHKVMLATFLSGIIDYKNSSNADSAYMTIDGQKVKVTLAAKLNGTQQLFDSPTSSNAYAEDDEGEKHRVTLVATPSGTLELPTSETYNYAYLIDGNGNKHRVRMFALIAGGYEEVIVRGVAPLSLPNAIADGLQYLKAFGGTEFIPQIYIDTVTAEGKCAQASTPTPSSPVDIVCNNGAIKYGQHGKNLFDINNAVRIIRATSTEIPLDETPTITIENNGFVLGTPYHLYFVDYMIAFAGQTDTQYTLSVKQMAGVDEVGIAFIYSDGTVSRTRYQDTTLTYRTYTSDANKTVVGFALDYGNGSQTLTLQDIQIELGTTATSFEPYYFGLYTDGTQETVTDALGNVANCKMLLAAGTYKDTQEILSGVVTRNVGIKVLDGSEDWITYWQGFRAQISDMDVLNYGSGFCSHFQVLSSGDALGVRFGADTNQVMFLHITDNISGITDITTWKQWLADQYTNGTPVMIVYPLATATTENTPAQTLLKAPVTATGSLSDLVATVVSSSHTTPTPTQPLDINCNNGALKLSPNIFDDTRIPDLTSPIYGCFYIGETTSNFVVKIISTGSTESLSGLYFGVGEDPASTSNVSWLLTGASTPTRYELAINNRQYLVFYPNNAETWQKIHDAFRVMVYDSTTTIDVDVYQPYNDLITDGTRETIKVMQKNFFDVAHSRIADVGVEQPDGSYYFVHPSEIGIWTPAYKVVFNGKPNTQYTLSGKIKSTSTGVTVNLSLGWFYSDGTTSQGNPRGAFSDYTDVTAVSTAGKTVIGFGAYYDGMENMYVKDLQIELGTTATEYEPYFDGGTALAEMLLKVGDYQDEQEILSGDITRKVGVKVLDGTENWVYKSSEYPTFSLQLSDANGSLTAIPCTHFAGHSGTWASMPDGSVMLHGTNLGFRYDNITSSNDWKQWLTDQYAAGTPVIVIYPLATPTTESVAGQSLTIADGDNIVDITEASMNNLELEVKYNAGASLTIEEVEDAQLTENVEVIIQ